MGLFDSILGGLQGNNRLAPYEAFAGILMAATACDGHFGDSEMQGVVASLLRMKLFQRLNEKQFSAMIDKLVGMIKRSGATELVERSLEVLPSDLRETVFVNACNVVLADGFAEKEEREFLAKLQQQLKIEPSTAQTIVQVIVIKNMG